MESKQADSKNEICISEENKAGNAETNPESSVQWFNANKSEISTAPESELIDVDAIELSDEESWLYKSPRKLSADKAERTEKWLHKDIDEMNERELCTTKDALLSKLNLLQMSDKIEYPSTCIKSISSIELSNFEEMKADLTDGAKSQHPVNGKENDMLDVADVHKIAQLQEESLRQSTSHLLSQAALNVCNGKIDSEGGYGLVPMHLSKQNGLYGSASCLHSKQDVHRGSLPNISPDCCSLRSKTPRRPSVQKVSCPLPIYPHHTRLPSKAVGHQTFAHESHLKTSCSLLDYRESHTLPSSYRMHSRSHSSSRKDLSTLLPSPQRESTSYLSGSRNSPVQSFVGRESAPCNPTKYSSPVSSPVLYQRSNVSTSALQSPTRSNRNPPQNLRKPSNGHTCSHSSSKRLPLMTVHNHSPNSPALPHKQDFKLASKIQSPVLKSGIPVPSSAYISRMNSDDEAWNHDYF